MRRTLASVFSLLLGYALLMLANGLFTTLIGVRTKIEGFATEVVGFVAAGYFAGLLLGGLSAVRVVAAVGHIRAFAVFASLLSVAALSHPLWVDPIAWGAMRTLAGYCMAGMVMVTESWLNERCDNFSRGRVLALYMITNYFAAGSGQFLLPLADPGGFRLFSLASILFSLALLPVLMTRASAPRPVPRERAALGELWRVSPLGLIGAACTGLTNSAFFGLGAVFAHGLGLTLAQTSSFIASVMAGGLLLQWPLGRLSDRIDRRTVLASIAVVSALAAGGILFATARSVAALNLAALCYGGITLTLYSISAAHANDFADPEQRVRTASGLLVAYAVGACIGPIAAGGLMGAIGPHGLFIWTGCVYALLGVFAFLRMLLRRAQPLREPIVALPGGQFTGGQLYAALREQLDRDLGAGSQDTAERSRGDRGG